MEKVQVKTRSTGSYFTLAAFVLIACCALFGLDRETHSISDLLKPGNQIALLLYFTPTFGITCSCYLWFSRKYKNADSIILALVIGIPVGFILVIGVLGYMMKWWG